MVPFANTFLQLLLQHIKNLSRFQTATEISKILYLESNENEK